MPQLVSHTNPLVVHSPPVPLGIIVSFEGLSKQYVAKVLTGTSICISFPSQQVTIHEQIAVLLPTVSIGHEKRTDRQAI